MGSLTGSLEHRWNSISTPIITSFLNALLLGFIAHITVLTNHLYNHDSVLNALIDPLTAFGIQQGKWFSLPVGLLTLGTIVTPATVLTPGLLLLAITVALTVSILKLQSRIRVAITSAFLVLFPSVMCTNVYRSTSTIFSALLLATTSVYVAIRYRYGLWRASCYTWFPAAPIQPALVTQWTVPDF